MKYLYHYWTTINKSPFLHFSLDSKGLGLKKTVTQKKLAKFRQIQKELHTWEKISPENRKYFYDIQILERSSRKISFWMPFYSDPWKILTSMLSSFPDEQKQIFRSICHILFTALYTAPSAGSKSFYLDEYLQNLIHSTTSIHALSAIRKESKPFDDGLFPEHLEKELWETARSLGLQNIRLPQHLIHGDLHPENILIHSTTHEIKFLDLGFPLPHLPDILYWDCMKMRQYLRGDLSLLRNQKQTKDITAYNKNNNAGADLIFCKEFFKTWDQYFPKLEFKRQMVLLDIFDLIYQIQMLPYYSGEKLKVRISFIERLLEKVLPREPL